MQTFLQTRGKQSDYRFLGASPPQSWWQDFRDATSFEQPTLIVMGDKTEWKAYLSGINSSRTDRVGTTIRYTVVMQGSCADEDGRDHALRRIAAWLDEPRRLGEVIDRVLDESRIEGLLATSSQEDLSPLEFKLDAVGATEQGWQGSWVSSIHAKKALNALLERIKDLLAGTQQGFAACLNLLGKTEEVQTFAAKHSGECAVLLDVAADTFEDDFERIERPAPKQPSAHSPTEITPPSTHTHSPYPRESRATNTGQPREGNNLPLVLGSVLLLLLLILLAFFSSPPKQSPPKPADRPTPTLPTMPAEKPITPLPSIPAANPAPTPPPIPTENPSR